MNLDPNVLAGLHAKLLPGCHRCQLRTAVLHSTSLPRPHPLETCPCDPSIFSLSSEFEDRALFLRLSTTPTRGLICYHCRSPQSICQVSGSTPIGRSHLTPTCRFKLSSSDGSDLDPVPVEIWRELVCFLLSSHPVLASNFVLEHRHAANYTPPPSWSSLPPPVLTPTDFAEWFAHAQLGMDLPKNIVNLSNGACLVVYLFQHHFDLSA